jgi:basic membrane protein A
VTSVASVATVGGAEVRAEGESDARVALLVNQSAGDLGPIDDMVAGLERVEEDFGVETTFIEILDPSAYESGLRNLGNEGYDVVVLAFPQIADALSQVAPDFPDTLFVHIYAFDDTLDNAITIGFASHEGVYLAGLLAAGISETDKLGYVGGASIPSLNANFNAFAAGAAAQGITDVTATWADSFEDPAKGRDLASALYDDGVSVIMMDGAATDQGVIEAAEEKGGYAIGFSNATFVNDTVVPAAVHVSWGELLYQQVDTALNGDFVAGHVDATLADGVFDLEINDDFLDAAPAEIAEAVNQTIPIVDEARAAIIAGDLVVEYDPDL